MLDQAWIDYLAGLPFAKYHGARTGYLGGGVLYYAMAYGLRARVCVCLGSGGGFVPLLMSRGQRDAGVTDARCVLVDACVPERGWGSPLVKGGWADGQAQSSETLSAIEVICDTTQAAAARLMADGAQLDYVHIDADHTMDGCYGDIESYLPLMAETSVMTVHDTRYVSVQRALGLLRQFRPDFDVVDFPELAQGVAVARRRLSHAVSPRLPEARPSPDEDVKHGERLRQLRLYSDDPDYTEG